eukprot:TRINITY_DN1543_c0_g2_i9.p2 TRINITY_DN1543_c0_g2~~TRINITY_DN1543_c0_g2_i9.p2  ORF type:complete len:135 (-),score=24.32 TRINITY_DN1543_c0_g2_i9:56-460(-)
MALNSSKMLYDKKAKMRATLSMHAIFIYLVLQFSILARMVWFDFNWDIVEPMTYFVGLGTTLVGYSFFLTYKSEYSYAAVQERQRKKFLRKLYLKNDFNWRRWNGLDVKIKGLVNYVGKENLPEHLKGIVPPEE